jgi:hypothetical protein
MPGSVRNDPGPLVRRLALCASEYEKTCTKALHHGHCTPLAQRFAMHTQSPRPTTSMASKGKGGDGGNGDAGADNVLECANDGCTEPGVHRCSRCRGVMYCSTSCQKVDWKHGGHKHACKKRALSATSCLAMPPVAATTLGANTVLECANDGCTEPGVHTCTAMLMGCRVAKYCSAACQKAHKKVHLPTCRAQWKARARGAADQATALPTTGAAIVPTDESDWMPLEGMPIFRAADEVWDDYDPKDERAWLVSCACIHDNDQRSTWA